MALPYPNLAFTPFDVLTAEELNHVMDNIHSLADGSGLDDDSIRARHLADGIVDSSKISFGPFTPLSIDSNNFTGVIEYRKISTDMVHVYGNVIAVTSVGPSFLRLTNPPVEITPPWSVNKLVRANTSSNSTVFFRVTESGTMYIFTDGGTVSGHVVIDIMYKV